ncbi:MAG: 2TM domain-containing protein [Myxococcaceae bacterium]|nr:2TM domain-containing protein [Myxococcaceae bacterium]
MPEDRSNDQSYDRARKRVADLRDFYSHLAVYLVVNLCLFILNMMTSPETRWFLWPLIGWGIGILIHGLSVIFSAQWSKKWEDRKIHQLMEKDRSRWGSQPPRPHAP